MFSLLFTIVRLCGFNNALRLLLISGMYGHMWVYFGSANTWYIQWWCAWLWLLFYILRSMGGRVGSRDSFTLEMFLFLSVVARFTSYVCWFDVSECVVYYVEVFPLNFPFINGDLVNFLSRLRQRSFDSKNKFQSFILPTFRFEVRWVFRK